ncbi:MAG: hypothetical protein AAGH65_10310 [Pseudomonadota bacterium]
MSVQESAEVRPSAWALRRREFFRPERIGQTVASVCWITSMFVYGINSGGDWLQLGAASAWFLANMAAVLAADA